MSKNISITIDDHDSNCTLFYTVEYKPSTETAYNTFTYNANPILIENLSDATIYDIRITRNCCNGGTSVVSTTSVDTTTVTPQVDTPANFIMVAGGLAGELDVSWDIVTTPDADFFVCEISTMSTFNVIAHTLTTTNPTISGTWTGATTGVLYYGRVKAQTSGYADSDWSNVDTATAP